MRLGKPKTTRHRWTASAARFRLRAILLIMAIFGVGGAAAEVLQQDTCYIAPEEVVTGNLFVLCRELVIEGRVTGNLIGAAYSTSVSGTIERNLYLLGGEVEMRGTLASDLHFAGVSLQILPETTIEDGDVLALALSTVVRPEVQIPGSMVGIGYQLVMDGTVEREIDFWGSALRISGTVSGDVTASVGNSQSPDVASQLETLLLPLQFEVDVVNPGLILTETGAIDGLLTYQGTTQGRFDGTLQQPATYIPTITNDALLDLVEEDNAWTALGFYLQQVIREFTTLGLIGLLGLLIIPEIVQRPIRALRRQPMTSLGVGLLTFILSFPVVVIVLLFSLIIIIVLGLLRLDGVTVAGGILLGIVNIGGTSLFYFVAIFVSRMILAIALGRVLVARVGSVSTARSWFVSLLVGVTLLALLGSLPTIGWVINAVALFLGLGAILTVIQGEMRALRDNVAHTAPVYYAEGESDATADETAISVTMPPPMLEARVPEPGMDNLPPGFTLDWLNRD
jgi:hypothetical protein